MASQSDIGETVRAALRDRQDLIAVYLFGSVARDQAHNLSDVDVAVLFRAGLAPEVIFSYTLEIGATLEEVLRCPVDVIALNRASPALRFQVLKQGHLVL